MIADIRTLEDVDKFVREVIKEGCVYHPDDNFHHYVNTATKEKSYSEEEADLRNRLNMQSFEICEKNGADIYSFSLRSYLLESELYKLGIPVPTEEDIFENRLNP